uniref:Uncharacterized protein n=1 Tax=Anguilla anguilla TaxID=7936 RepID=A0A0E9XKM8_ANGAN
MHSQHTGQNVFSAQDEPNILDNKTYKTCSSAWADPNPFLLLHNWVTEGLYLKQPPNYGSSKYVLSTYTAYCLVCIV